MTVKTKKKVYEYPITIQITYADGAIDNIITQLYQMGVYVIINNDPEMQFITSPEEIIYLEQKLKGNLESGEIKNIVFGRLIKVREDDNGLYQEVK